MLVVIALGGNALLRRGEPADVEAQRANVVTVVEAIAEIAREHDVVVTHGNGPQVGLLALQGEAYDAVDPYPLDVLGAIGKGYSYPDLLPLSSVQELSDGLHVRVLTLGAQIRIKEELGREKDLATLPTLRRALAESKPGSLE